MTKRRARNGVLGTSNSHHAEPCSELPPPTGARRPTCVVCWKPVGKDDFEESGDVVRHFPSCHVEGDGKKKRKAPFQAQAASLRLLREAGWVCDSVEKMAGPYKFDYLGFADIVGIRGGLTCAVQVTTDNGGHVAERREKILRSRWAKRWLEEGGSIAIHGWKKVKGAWCLHRTLWFSIVVDEVVAREE